MNDRLELAEDRLDDLESYIIKLTQEQKQSRQANRHNLSRIATVNVMVVPIVILILVLLGLDINYQSDNKKISYNSKGLIEVTLLVITTFSGGYIANRYRNEHTNE